MNFIASESSVPVKGDKDIAEIDEKPHASDVFSTYAKRGKSKSNGKKDKIRVRLGSFAFNDALCKTSALGLNPIGESKQQGPLSMCNSWKRKRKHVGAKERSYQNIFSILFCLLNGVDI